MTTTSEIKAEVMAWEPIAGGCPACRSTAGAYGGCCFVCSCPTPEWQRRNADARALAFGANGKAKPEVKRGALWPLGKVGPE